MQGIRNEIYRIMKDQQYKPYIIERYLLLYGVKNTKRLLDSFSRPPVPSIRVNTEIIGVQKLRHLLDKKGYHLEPVPWCDGGFWIYDKFFFNRTLDPSKTSHFKISPGATHEYMQGFYSLQGASSMLPTVLLDPRPGDLILDMAAAPGSKFIHIAQKTKNKGLIIGVDRSKDRIKALLTNVYRCGVKNSVIIHQDARKLENTFKNVDKILLDAPCTGEGLIGADPTRKYSRTLKDMEKLMPIQIQLLNKAVDLVRPGGRIVYSTCSIAPEENEHVVNEVLKKHSNLRLVDAPSKIKEYFEPGLKNAFDVKFHPSLEKAIRVYPYHAPQRPEGFFCAIIEKRS
ncbi:MAG: RsmB/NOP family class I SAM-dependent RNA methyltransferase [Promethearchaeota archaeon]